MKPNLDLSNQQTQLICDVLTQLLADLYTLALKYQYFHWNVEGESFMTWHQLSEAHYTELFKFIDEVAERIRALGHYAPGNFKTFLHKTKLQEFCVPDTPPTMLTALLQDHEKMIQYLRTHLIPSCQKNNDESTVDLLSGLLRLQEKFAWMIRSSLT